MTWAASHRLLPDGRRLHLQHGPIDIIAEAQGAPDEVARAYEQAVARFATVLCELTAELPVLRTAVQAGECPLRGAIARRMWRAVRPFAVDIVEPVSRTPHFVTPMAAVAGAVAESVLASMVAGRDLARAYVNNGGDIALHLSPGADAFRLAIVVDPQHPASPGTVEIAEASDVRGIATSGWRGRSFSLGVADSVTVFDRSAAQADVAATMIANAVDLPGHPAVIRKPAAALAPDSDLGERCVTVEVGILSRAEIYEALARGEALAEELLRTGLASGASLVVKNVARLVGTPPPLHRATRDSAFPGHREARLGNLRMRSCINAGLGPFTLLGERSLVEGQDSPNGRNVA